MNKKGFLQMVQFGIVGASNSLLTILVFRLLSFMSVPYMIANVCGYAVGMCNSYFWNHKYVFKQNASTENMMKFIVSNLFMMLFSTLCMYCFVTFFALNKNIAMVASMIISMGINFLITKFWIFRK